MGCCCNRVRGDKKTKPGKLEMTSDIPGAILRGLEKVKPDDIDALLAVDLPESVILNIKRWWKGEISGMTCVKTILDLGVRVAAGYVGERGVEIVGTTVGKYLAGDPGAMIGAAAAEYLFNLLTEWVFGLPQSEALENAFTFLNVSPNASDSKINSQYKRLARKYRTNTENWTRLQYSLAVIKASRGNL